jgi:hypothetical protein
LPQFFFVAASLAFHASHTVARRDPVHFLSERRFPPTSSDRRAIAPLECVAGLLA